MIKYIWLLLIFCSCKNKIDKETQVIQKDTINIISNNVDSLKHNINFSDEKDLRTFIDTLNRIKNLANKGNKLVLKKFPKKWKDSTILNKKRLKNVYESYFETLRSELHNEIFLTKEKLTIDTKTLLKIIKVDSEKNYLNKILTDSVDVSIAKVLSLDFKEMYSISFSSEIDCKCEYGRYYDGKYIINIDSSNKIANSFELSFTEGNDLERTYKLYYIDTNKIIHIKHLKRDEEFGYLVRYEKYRISPQGNFIRYYDKDGNLNNEREQGVVLNHTREGYWVEKGFNYSLYKYIYSETNHLKGLPMGNHKFYELKLDGYRWFPNLSTATKGKLLYTETYKKGELIERVFVK